MTAKDTAIMSLTLGICAMVLGLLGSWSVAGLALGGAGLFCGLHAAGGLKMGPSLPGRGFISAARPWLFAPCLQLLFWYAFSIETEELTSVSLHSYWEL